MRVSVQKGSQGDVAAAVGEARPHWAFRALNAWLRGWDPVLGALGSHRGL